HVDAHRRRVVRIAVVADEIVGRSQVLEGLLVHELALVAAPSPRKLHREAREVRARRDHVRASEPLIDVEVRREEGEDDERLDHREVLIAPGAARGARAAAASGRATAWPAATPRPAAAERRRRT